ncbi:MAG: hypothetical protein INR73_13915 [Williamsia sp.]|nr:hypothetical protein [Williamsia sp.]
MLTLIRFILLTITTSTICFLGAQAQSKAILEAPRERQLPLLWHYCTENYISDKDSLTTAQFLTDVIRGADSSGNDQLKAYAQYFQQCQKVLFSQFYERYFVPENQRAINTLSKTQTWALKNRYYDIAASCENYMGQVYYKANHYGAAFEHFLKADNDFRNIGYQHVPNASYYLYVLGLSFYRFEEYDKALAYFLQATNYGFYLTLREEINTLNTIGLIYALKNEDAKAITFFRNTAAKARQYKEAAWIGIASGNIGNVLLHEHKYDSALFYHRINYSINGNLSSEAPEDAAKTALSIATIYLQKDRLDSARFYITRSQELAAPKYKDSTERLEFDRRLLEVNIAYAKKQGDLHTALLLTDSIAITEQNLRRKLDNKILSRAIEKTEIISHKSNLALLESQNDLLKLRFYIIIAVFLIVVIIFREKWLRKKQQMQLDEKDKQILLMQKTKVEDSLAHSKELLNAYVDTIKEKTTMIERLESELNDLKKVMNNSQEGGPITSNREKLIMSTISTDQDWQQFRILFEQVYPGFSHQLKEMYPDLSPAESRFLFLAKLDLSPREMAVMLGISVDAIHKLRYRLRKKLNIEDTSFKTVIRKIDEHVHETKIATQRSN